MRRFLLLGVLVLVLFFLPGLSNASPSGEFPGWYKPFRKLGRGAANTVTAPLEILNQTYILAKHQEEEHANPAATLAGVAAGPFVGVVYGLWRLTAGVYDLVTFPFPSYEFCLVQPEFLTPSAATEAQEEPEEY
jgi:putative exosortase-associated protein (TIGR04073 family)